MKTTMILALTLAALCASCTNYNLPPQIAAGPQPTEAEVNEVITWYMQMKLKDPGSLQQVQVVGMKVCNLPSGGGKYNQLWAHGLPL